MAHTQNKPKGKWAYQMVSEPVSEAITNPPTGPKPNSAIIINQDPNSNPNPNFSAIHNTNRGLLTEQELLGQQFKNQTSRIISELVHTIETLESMKLSNVMMSIQPINTKIGDTIATLRGSILSKNDKKTIHRLAHRIWGICLDLTNEYPEGYDVPLNEFGFFAIILDELLGIQTAAIPSTTAAPIQDLPPTTSTTIVQDLPPVQNEAAAIPQPTPVYHQECLLPKIMTSFDSEEKKMPSEAPANIKQVYTLDTTMNSGKLTEKEEVSDGLSKHDDTATDNQPKPLQSNPYTTENSVPMPTVHYTEIKVHVPSVIEFDDDSFKPDFQISSSNDDSQFTVEDKHAALEIDASNKFTTKFVNECIFGSDLTTKGLINISCAFEWCMPCRKPYGEEIIFVFDPGGIRLECVNFGLSLDLEDKVVFKGKGVVMTKL